MEPIVNPWFVYLLGVVDGASSISGAACFILVLTTLLTGLFYGLSFSDDGLKTCVPLLLRTLKWSVAGLITFLLLTAFIPSRNTLIGMYVAGSVTTDTVKSAVDAGNDFRETVKADIIEIIRAVNEDGE